MKQPAQKQKKYSHRFFGRHVSLSHKAIFAKNLSVMLKSGLPIIEALDVVAESTRGYFKKVIIDIRNSVRSGHTLSDSLSVYPKIFSGLFINSARAGEESGTLDSNLENISVQLDKELALSSKIKGAMLYPVIVFILTFSVALLLTFFVLPKIIPLFEGLDVDLPASTKALIWFSGFIEQYGGVFFLGLISGIFLFVWTIKRKFSRPVTHWIILHTPIIGRVARNANISKFCLTLGTLLKSGLAIDEALEITKDTVSNYYYQKAASQVSLRVGKGGKLSFDMEEYHALFSVMGVRMIRVGEESGRLDETLLYLNTYYERQVDSATKALAASIEPILLIVIGATVGFLAISIITPIYDITGNIQR